MKDIVSHFTFHELARLIAAASTGVAVLLSLYLIWRHALSYTKPREQRHIIRILFMVPVYSVSSLLQIIWYEQAVYIAVVAHCYEAFALAAFFALVCHYVAPDVHAQKAFFRDMTPVRPWIWPLRAFARCCGGQRGPWRTPRSGLTWFNICWVAVYQYCFVRVASAVVAVAAQAAGRYCESSNSPAFANIWLSAVNMAAVSVAMVCVVQVYVQLRDALAPHRLFVKILAIKLVVFLVLWQTILIKIGTATVDALRPGATLSNGDLKVGIPCLLICVEMALFALLHLWAFPYRPYAPGAPPTFYPAPDPARPGPDVENRHQPPSGGPAGLRAIVDAMNPWDLVKAVGRGLRWLFVGVKHRNRDLASSAAVPLTARPSSQEDGVAARVSDGSDAPLKPQATNTSDDATPPPDYSRGSHFPAPGHEQRYEPMRGGSSEDAAYLHHMPPPEPYDAGRQFIAPSPPPESHAVVGQRTEYRTG
ncbi:hypothetical protein AK830_g457 [Neonectria ditissima]|uniref:Transmembrane protein 184 n=1 Tax=Neonectria ditissima TaxID=78410 RepID=A0A0P7BVZ3_9HYPO|nr:hypothetical protein AK830_g457 [Neonectria ditissima]